MTVDQVIKHLERTPVGYRVGYKFTQTRFLDSYSSGGRGALLIHIKKYKHKVSLVEVYGCKVVLYGCSRGISNLHIKFNEPLVNEEVV